MNQAGIGDAVRYKRLRRNGDFHHGVVIEGGVVLKMGNHGMISLLGVDQSDAETLPNS